MINFYMEVCRQKNNAVARWTLSLVLTHFDSWLWIDEFAVVETIC